MHLRVDFPSSTTFLAIVALVVLSLEVALVVTGAGLVSLLFSQSARRTKAVRAWLLGSALALLLFDGVHLLL
jgi:hypothetical protein